jgi:hypothetical protein
MTKALADMVTELQEDVPAVDAVPSDAQYERAIKDAVAEFSRLCGLVKNTTLSIVSGTATYALPADFLKLIEIENPYDSEQGVLVTATGIIPFGGLTPFEEEITIRNGVLTIYPTPAYTMTRYLEYKAAWVLDESDEYPLTDDEVEIVMLKAKEKAFEKLFNANTGTGGIKYSIGNMSVDKTGASDGYSKRMYALHGEFAKACEDYNGSVQLC